MNEHLPVASLCGMADPIAWLTQVARSIAQRHPDTPPCWHTSPTGHGMVAWHTTTGADEPLSIWLWATATAVAIRVWHSAWQGMEVIGEGAYGTLMTTIATTLIDQDSDPDGPAIHLHVQAVQLHTAC